MNAQFVERLGAVIAGVAVAVVAFYALYKDWHSTGVENQVFKLMLALLGFGAVLALLAGLNVIGFTPPKGAY
jgi:hypothetical protein